MTVFPRLPLLVCLMAGLSVLNAADPPKPPTPQGEAAEDEGLTPQVDIGALATVPPPAQPPSIQAPSLPEKPAAGQGRLRIDVDGSRRWCTFPDDRVVKPPAKSGAGPAARNPVYTFGYMFSVAAVNRSRPAETLMLYESPVFRTAVLRQAAKLGKGKAVPSNRGPVVGETPERITIKDTKTDPSAMVPYWQEAYRCTSLPEAFDFDVAPGTYDVYVAFDILLRSGNWTHRSIAYATDVTITEGSATRLQATAGMQSAGRRELTLGLPLQDASTTGAR
jgi:hypothetical protein